MANKNGLKLDPEDIWGKIKDVSQVFAGTVNQALANSAKHSIIVDADKDEKNAAGQPCISDSGTLRVYSQLIVSASTLNKDQFKNLLDKVGEKIQTGVVAAGAAGQDYVSMANIAAGILDKILNNVSTKQIESKGRFLIDTSLPLDKDTGAEKPNEGDITQVEAHLEFGGRFYSTDDDGDASFDFTATLKTKSDSDEVQMNYSDPDNGKIQIIKGKKDSIKITHGPNANKDKDPNGFQPALKKWYKYEVNLNVKGPVDSGGWPLTIDIDIDSYAKPDVNPPILPSIGDNTIIVTVEELKLHLKCTH